MKKTDFEYDIAKQEKFFYEQLSEQQKRDLPKGFYQQEKIWNRKKCR